MRKWASSLILAVVLTSAPVSAADLRVLSTPTLKSALDEIAPAFEKATGHKINAEYKPVSALKKQIDEGQSFDLAILLPPTIDDLVKTGKIVSGSKTMIARAAYGMGVHQGTQKPDISNVEAFKRALLAADSISYSPDSNASAYFLSVIERLGLTFDLKPKLKASTDGNVIAPVASGQAQMVVITMPNLVGVPGLDLVGPIPPELQNYSEFAAGVGSSSNARDEAEALVSTLRSAQGVRILESKGMDVPK